MLLLYSGRRTEANFVGLDELRSRRNRGPVPQTKNGAGSPNKKRRWFPKPKTAVPKRRSPNKLPAEIARRNRVPAASVGGRGK